MLTMPAADTMIAFGKLPCVDHLAQRTPAW